MFNKHALIKLHWNANLIRDYFAKEYDYRIWIEDVNERLSKEKIDNTTYPIFCFIINGFSDGTLHGIIWYDFEGDDKKEVEFLKKCTKIIIDRLNELFNESALTNIPEEMILYYDKHFYVKLDEKETTITISYFSVQITDEIEDFDGPFMEYARQMAMER